MKQAYEKYKLAGFSTLPTKKDKSPDVKGTWLGGVHEGYENANGIGIICGKASGGLECGDFDNHFGDAKQILSQYIMIPEVKAIYEKYKLPIEASMSGGFHLLWRCDTVEKNQKLASRLLTGKPDAIIETRGENGYFVAAPSPGYKVIKNDITKIAKITYDERKVLIDYAKSFNEVVKNDYKPQQIDYDERPGDKYAKTLEAIEDMKSCLRLAGWKEESRGWTRPGKDSGISATVGKVAPHVFYVFSSNASPFEGGKGYDPFQVISLLDYNGNFSDFAKVLAEKYNDTPSYKKEKQDIKVVPKKQESDYDKILNAAYIDRSIPIQKPPICMKIRDRSGGATVDKRLFTLGNFSAITGKGKSKKTFLTSILLSAACRNTIVQEKITGNFPSGKNSVLLFDTEQSLYDAYTVSNRVISLVGYECAQFGSFALREYLPKERVAIIEHALNKFKDNLGYVVIDGIADLTTAINDEEKANEAVGHLMRWSKNYNCHITVIIHQNKNDDYATGHLGSSIIKKAEAVIKVSKMKDANKSHIECDVIRGTADFNDFDFSIDENGLPVIDNLTTYETSKAF